MVKFASIVVCASIFIAGVATAQQAAPTARNITGVLKGINTRNGTLVITSVGADVDQVLLEKMREQGRAPAADRPKTAPAAAKEDMELRITGKTGINVSFRTSPSVANSLERSLAELEPMIGYPVSIELGPTPTASKITVWRGTPRITR